MKQIFFIFLCAFILYGCGDRESDYTDPRGKEYAGSESCVQCHASVSHSSMMSAHFKATALALPENVMGSFGKKGDVFEYDPQTTIRMEKRGDSLYQVLYQGNKQIHAYPFDIVFGNRHAQTAVYWRDHNTYELPVSYYTSLNGWATSPGYPADHPYFDRKAVKDCFACHSSNASSTLGGKEKDNFMGMDVEDVIRKESVVYGIDCERCHGPAQKHVDYHLKFPDEKQSHNIVAFSKLSRQQKLDACAICHSGNKGMMVQSRFGFKPGDNLSDYFRNVTTGEFDVHGNQFGLLSQSQCFLKSNMDCTTCHNPHENVKGNNLAYAQQCLSCHKTGKHQPVEGKVLSIAELSGKCIECHMPKQASKAIVFKVSGSHKDAGYELRTHKIAVYPAN